MDLEQMQDDEILNEAMKQGYNPEYEGENKKSPKEYLEVSFNHNKVLRERNEKLSKTVEQLNDKLDRVVQFQNEQKQKAVDAAIRKLKAERNEAITEGDLQKVETLDKEIEVQQQDIAKPDSSPILDEWLQNNPWYNQDEDLAIEADLIAQQLQATGRFKTNEADYKKLLSQVEVRIRRAFPDKFKNPKKDQPPEVEDGQPSSQRKSKHTYAELPPEAKKACDEFVADKVMTKEQYLEIYEWD